MLKRPLHVYDDLAVEEVEDGEISEQENQVISEEDDDFSMRPVLPVGRFDENFRENDEPTSGEQYLCLVRHQRKKLPQLEVDKSAQASAGKSIQELLAGFEESKPVKEINSEWAEGHWNQYRQNEETLKAAWSAVEEVDVKFPPTKDQAVWLEYFQNTKPTTDICVALMDEQELVVKLIQHHIHWIGNALVNNYEWLNTLLLVLDRQLSSHQISVLRQLVKTLSQVETHEKIDEMITVIVKAYGQHDLVKFTTLNK